MIASTICANGRTSMRIELVRLRKISNRVRQLSQLSASLSFRIPTWQAAIIRWTRRPTASMTGAGSKRRTIRPGRVGDPAPAAHNLKLTPEMRPNLNL
ncbi:hypothetical protein MPTK2_1g13710 [Marchantia polymorpha subsp. ruderalis]